MKRGAITLVNLYNAETFNNTVTLNITAQTSPWDGISAANASALTKRTMVQRIISLVGNTLDSTQGSAGKLREMAAAAMKLAPARPWLKKPMFVVPKSVLAQWGRNSYPSSPMRKYFSLESRILPLRVRREFNE